MPAPTPRLNDPCYIGQKNTEREGEYPIRTPTTCTPSRLGVKLWSGGWGTLSRASGGIFLLYSISSFNRKVVGSHFGEIERSPRRNLTVPKKPALTSDVSRVTTDLLKPPPNIGPKWFDFWGGLNFLFKDTDSHLTAWRGDNTLHAETGEVFRLVWDI